MTLIKCGRFLFSIDSKINYISANKLRHFVVSQKNFYFFCRGGGRRREQMRINRNIGKNLKLEFDKKSCQYDGNCNNNYYFSDNKNKKQQ